MKRSDVVRQTKSNERISPRLAPGMLLGSGTDTDPERVPIGAASDPAGTAGGVAPGMSIDGAKDAPWNAPAGDVSMASREQAVADLAFPLTSQDDTVGRPEASESVSTDAGQCSIVFRLFPLQLCLHPSTTHPTRVSKNALGSELTEMVTKCTTFRPLVGSVREIVTGREHAEATHSRIGMTSFNRMFCLQDASPMEWHAGETANLRLELAHGLPYALERFRVRVEMRDASETMLLLERLDETALPPERCRAWSLRLPFETPGEHFVSCQLLLAQPSAGLLLSTHRASPGSAFAKNATPISPTATPMTSFQQTFRFQVSDAWQLEGYALAWGSTTLDKRSERGRQTFLWLVNIQNTSHEPLYLLAGQCRPDAPTFQGSEKPLEPPETVPYIASPMETQEKAPFSAGPSPASGATASTSSWKLMPLRFRTKAPLLSPGDRARFVFMLHRRPASSKSANSAPSLDAPFHPGSVSIQWRTTRGVLGERTWVALSTRWLPQQIYFSPLPEIPEGTGTSSPYRIVLQFCRPAARIRLETPFEICYTIEVNWSVPHKYGSKTLQTEFSAVGTESPCGVLHLEAETLPGTLLPIGNCTRHLVSLYSASACSIRFWYFPLREGCFPIPRLIARESDQSGNTAAKAAYLLPVSTRRLPFGHCLLYIHR